MTYYIMKIGSRMLYVVKVCYSLNHATGTDHWMWSDLEIADRFIFRSVDVDNVS